MQSNRTNFALILFLLGFTVLLIFVSHFYLFPAMEAQKGADPLQKSGLTAWSRLLLVILLIILIAGMILSVRLGRLFFPRGDAPKPTRYVDAWTEAGKRTPPPPLDDAEDDDIE